MVCPAKNLNYIILHRGKEEGGWGVGIKAEFTDALKNSVCRYLRKVAGLVTKSLQALNLNSRVC